MDNSRRDFLKSTARAAAVMTLPATASAMAHRPISVSPASIAARFQGLPGDLGWKILVTRPDRSTAFVAGQDAGRRLFAASAIKTFVLAEVLRQFDSPDIAQRLEQHELVLDSAIWSLGSPIFNPPNLTGIVSARTALEAMITRSDNTATDMAFKLAGAANVRRFIADAGLSETLVPDSTRAFTAYLWGAPDYTRIGWEELLALIQRPMLHPFFNEVQTLASSAEDMVSYYSRALQGDFFVHAQTLDEFRRILSLCDYIRLVPLPEGVGTHAKSGNADTEGFHVRTIAGGLNVTGTWITFAFMLNWYNAQASDADTVERLFGAINAALEDLVEDISAPRRRLPLPLIPGCRPV
ncbi:MAG: serine hydrolase [Dokdonella sp.]|uniref:serine hydrolase n=1 Tax=Dokdonella sp. TaxID=2291710 RepID=UPI0025C5A161|nr:serine hydrolase [Dokdonella sp.]MBZ0224326.1 serine hydrolase [Dokdonella sp.]